MADCYIGSKVHSPERRRSDAAFMGRTHATSAVALFLGFIAFFPLLTEKVLGTNNFWLVLAAAITAAGASLLPDLDNTSSTARNSLGPVGHVCSEAFRALSVVIQTSVRTGRDAKEPNPHRGALHTIPAALLFGAAALFATRLGGEVNLPLLGETPWGGVAAMVTVFITCHLALSGLFKPFMNKVADSSPVGELVELGLSAVVAVGLYTQFPAATDYWWLGVAVFVGYAVHILGDCFTTAGCPVLFPIPRKGKLWYNVRFLSIKAGGTVENVLFVPFFTIVIAISSLRIIGLL